MFKKCITIVLIISFVFLAAGCGKSNPKSIEDARKHFKKYNWIISEDKSGLFTKGVHTRFNANKGLRKASYIEYKDIDSAKASLKEMIDSFDRVLTRRKYTQNYARYEGQIFDIKIIIIRKDKYIFQYVGGVRTGRSLIKGLGMN